MNMGETLEKLSQIDCSSVITMSPGPYQAAVSYKDGIAARLLLWLAEVMPDDATTGDVEDVLTSALWWHIYFLTMHKAQKMEVER